MLPRTVAAVVALVLSACILPRPHHRTALAIDAGFAVAGIGLLAYDAYDCRDAGPDGCHLHSPSSASIFGPVLLGGALIGALVTAIISAEPRTPPAPGAGTAKAGVAAGPRFTP